ncbi:cytochrome ubiquinol oxidase subunit I [Actinomycetota bacterium]
MDAVDIARLQFALTAGLHFVLVATTLGLAPVLAALQTAYAARTGRAAGSPLGVARDVVARVYLVNYGAGIVTGIILELQIGMNWHNVPPALYDPVATTLAAETLLAFLVESTLLGLFLASPGRLSERVRAGLLWGVAATAALSAFLVVSANAYLHRPSGVRLGGEGSGSGWVDPISLLTNPSALLAIAHILPVAGMVGGAWVLACAVAAGRRDPEAGRFLGRCGALILAIASPLALVTGLFQFAAARESYLGVPPAYATIGLVLMMLIGVVLTLLSWVLAPLLWRWSGRPSRAVGLLRALPFVPIATTFLGWLYRETARQPWFIVGKVSTEDALSVHSVPLLAATTVAFVALDLVAVLGAWTLITRYLRQPPVREPAQTEPLVFAL